MYLYFKRCEWLNTDMHVTWLWNYALLLKVLYCKTIYIHQGSKNVSSIYQAPEIFAGNNTKRSNRWPRRPCLACRASVFLWEILVAVRHKVFHRPCKHSNDTNKYSETYPIPVVYFLESSYVMQQHVREYETPWTICEYLPLITLFPTIDFVYFTS